MCVIIGDEIRWWWPGAITPHMLMLMLMSVLIMVVYGDVFVGVDGGG